MKRRDFVKTGICFGCAGALGAGITSTCNNLFGPQHISEKTFIYKSEKDLPTKIRLDVCNLCQLNCVKCWIRRDEELIKKEAGGFGYVPFKTFKDFIDRHPFIKDIEISFNGEIFLNPELEDIIKYAYEKGVNLTAYTGVNLNYLPESTAEALVKYKFTGLVVSVDGASPETYIQYRRGGDFNTVINNIKKINYYKAKYNSELPYLTYKFLLFGHNEHEIQKAKQLAKDLNMHIKFELNAFPDFSPLKNKEQVLADTGLSKVESFGEKVFENFKKDNTEFVFCKQMVEEPIFNWNGDLFGCCLNYLHPFGVNIFKDGMLKALNNKKFLYVKTMLADFSVKPDPDTFCYECVMYDYLKKNNIKLKLV